MMIIILILILLLMLMLILILILILILKRILILIRMIMMMIMIVIMIIIMIVIILTVILLMIITMIKIMTMITITKSCQKIQQINIMTFPHGLRHSCAVHAHKIVAPAARNYCYHCHNYNSCVQSYYHYSLLLLPILHPVLFFYVNTD